MHKHEDKYTFEYENNQYVFTILKRDKKELIYIEKCIYGNNIYDQIIRNKYNDIITTISNLQYIMIKKCKQKQKLEEVVGNNIVINDNKLKKHEWYELWIKKIDNIEYQLQHISAKFPLIEKSINYYIGMTESALTYLNDLQYNENNYTEEVISHVRINDDDIGDPQNLLIDYKSRDVSEYLKYLFINNIYDYDLIKKKISTLNFSEFEWKLVYVRLFFPNFYFDIYDEIINNKNDEEKLKKIIIRAEEYEIYVDNIYSIIYEQKKIPKITWN